MSDQQKIAVLFLGYNDQANLSEAITSVQKQVGVIFDIFYLDNASTDNSLQCVRENFSDVKILSEPKNLGYAGAYAKHLPQIFAQNYTAAVLLNTDVVVADNWLKNLVASAFADEKIASAQPKIYLWQNGPSDIFNTCGNPINFLGVGFSGCYGQLDTGKISTDQKIPYASGCCLLIKKTAFEHVGNLDPRFFMYLEDQDWGWRAQMQGFENIISSDSKMWHKYKFDSTRTTKFFFLERNRYFFLTKNYQLKTLLLLLPALLTLEIGILAHSLAKGYFGLKIKAYGAFFKDFGQIMHERQIIQKARQLPDSALFEKLCPTIEFKSLDSPLLRFANYFFKLYYNLIKFLI